MKPVDYFIADDRIEFGPRGDVLAIALVTFRRGNMAVVDLWSM